VNTEAFALREFEVAYHALMGALHIADHAGDTDILERVAALAQEQDAALESLHPKHPLSREAAAARRQPAIFATLKVHVDAVRLRVEGARQIRQAQVARADSG